MRRLWSSVVLVVGLRIARALVALGLRLAKRGDSIGTRVLGYVNRLHVTQRQQSGEQKHERETDDTPNERPGQAGACKACGRSDGHEPNCTAIGE